MNHEKKRRAIFAIVYGKIREWKLLDESQMLKKSSYFGDDTNCLAEYFNKDLINMMFSA